MSTSSNPIWGGRHLRDPGGQGAANTRPGSRRPGRISDPLALPRGVAGFAFFALHVGGNHIIQLAPAICGVCGLAIDNSRTLVRLRSMDAQRIRSNRLESIGILAGGLAHDLNNALMVFMGHAQVISSRAGTANPLSQSAEAILSSARWAAGIVERLLAAAAQQPLSFEETDLNDLVFRSTGIIRLLLDCRIEINTSLSDRTLPIRVDPGKISTVLIDLVSNANAAMPEGGLFTVRTGTEAENAFLSVSDTGMGSDGKTVERVFEPYFQRS